MKTKQLCLIIVVLSSFCVLMGALGMYSINITASLPRGIYGISREPLVRGTLVSFRLDPSMAVKYSSRSWYPPSGIFLKPLAGFPGETVQIRDTEVFVEENSLGSLQTLDRDGLPLVAGTFEGEIPRGYLMVGIPGDYSFDSRYFGLIREDQILQTWRLLWSWDLYE